jgi:hypothetical protein
MKAYWLGIDEATAKLDCHSGGFYGLAAVYTPELTRALQSRLLAAFAAADGDPNPAYMKRVGMHSAGFDNILRYQEICAAMAKGDFVEARERYDWMIKRIETQVRNGYANPEYGTAYLKRFLQRTIDGGVAATAAPNKVVRVLPDRWKFATDDADEGVARNYHAADFDDAKWKTAATYSATLSQQGLRENTVLWYRTTFPVPEGHGAMKLFFPEVDGQVTVYVNGKALEPTPVLPVPAKKKAGPDAPAVPRRAPFEVDLAPAVKAGDNVAAVRVDNRKISELFLGGILRPVLLVEKPPRP